MRWAGIDIGKHKHVVAVVDDDDHVVRKASTFQEDEKGFEALLRYLGEPEDLRVGLEATGHYWRNVYVWLVGRGYEVFVFNPAKTSQFARFELRRAKTDAADAVSIARCMRVSRLQSIAGDREFESLRELSRFRTRMTQDLGDRVRQLHRQIDLVFPELAKHHKKVGPMLTQLLLRWPTAKLMARAEMSDVAGLRFGARGRVGADRATKLVEAARASVAQHHGPVHERIMNALCSDIVTLQARIADIDAELDVLVSQHDLGGLMLTLPGVGMLTTARVLAEVGDPKRFKSGEALSAHIGLVPGTRHSGKSTPLSQPCDARGNARLRCALWMVTLTAIQQSLWLRAFYERLVARGKPKKVAMIATMRKLVLALYVVARDRKPFVEKAAPEPLLA